MSEEAALSLNIAEVSDLCGLKAHVLRYWETEFSQLRPQKKSGQRVYRQKDLDIIKKLKELLYVEQYSIAGARKKLEEDIREARRDQLPLALDLKEAELVGVLVRVKRQVASLRDALAKPLPVLGETEDQGGGV
jgi:DNA-binding transcriptional MerR regulator